VIGEPYSDGAVQSIFTKAPSRIVSGAGGASGIYAAKTEISLEYSLYPYMFLA
jgi:hypothetical protein